MHHVLPEQKVQLQLDLRHGLALPIEKQLAQRPFKILHIDKDLVVVDKAAGILASQPRRLENDKTQESHLSDILGRTLKKMGKEVHYVGYVHRLDQETSGCICLALNKEAHRHLAEQFATKEANRLYRCIVTGQPVQDIDTLQGLIVRGVDGRRRLVREELPGEHGEKAVTEFKVLERFDGGADCEVKLLTGRTHQVRVSMAAIGAPVFGDTLYGEKKKLAPRMMLHAWKLTLTHPKTEMIMTFEAPIPKEFKECRPPKAKKGERTGGERKPFGFDEDRSGDQPYRRESKRPRQHDRAQGDSNYSPSGERSEKKFGDRPTEGNPERKDADWKSSERTERKIRAYHAAGSVDRPARERPAAQRSGSERPERASRTAQDRNTEPRTIESRESFERPFPSVPKAPWKENPKRIDKPRDTVQYNKKPAKPWKDKV